MGAIMLSRADYGCYVLLRDNISSHYTMRTVNYPNNMGKYMQLLNNYKSTNKNHTYDLFDQ